MISIRQLVANDLNDFVRLMSGFYEYSGENDFDISSVHRLFGRVTGGAENFICIGAFTDNRMIGLCTLAFAESSYKVAPFAWADDLFVDPNYRKQGIAARLMEKAQQIAREHRCSNILLGVGSTEVHLQSFYAKQGFKDMNCKLFTLPLP